MAESLYLIVFLTAAGCLFAWALSRERRPPGPDRSPFAIRDAEDYRKRYGDRGPL